MFSGSDGIFLLSRASFYVHLWLLHSYFLRERESNIPYYASSLLTPHCFCAASKMLSRRVALLARGALLASLVAFAAFPSFVNGAGPPPPVEGDSVTAAAPDGEHAHHADITLANARLPSQATFAAMFQGLQHHYAWPLHFRPREFDGILRPIVQRIRGFLRRVPTWTSTSYALRASSS